MPHPVSFLLALTALALSACASPAYLWQASKGHLQLMGERRAVDDILADPETTPSLRNRLETADELLEFAEHSLDLPAGDSYRTLVEIGGPVTWNVVVTPEFSLQPKRWCFPVAGCVTYRGYFDRADANAFAERMSRKGFDVAVTPASAYSTLGWFDDPLLDTMLYRGDTQLAGTLFHELAHQRLYVRGSTAFNESYADFVETSGVQMWLASRQDSAEASQRWEQSRAAIDDLDRLLKQSRERLLALYASGQSQAKMRQAKIGIFEDLRSEYRDLVESSWQGQSYFGSWIEQGLNNAFLAGFRTYTGGRCAFASLMQQAEQDFRRFHDLAARQGERNPRDREKWLNQPCPVIASPGDL